MNNRDLEFLATLEQVILQRLKEKPVGSYTAQLVAAGDTRGAQKVGEEAIELALAATAGDRREQIEEAADLVYHLIVLLASKGIRLADVATTLSQRHAS